MSTQSSKRLIISFSGGRTSAYMTLHCLRYMADYETVIVFANTGCEHPATLDFVNKLDKHIGNKIVWLEAKINSIKGIGIRHTIVNYSSASRNGEPFEQLIAKYGFPSPANPNCTAKLKTRVIESYCRSIGWPTGEKSRTHKTAIGIRYDELDRMSSIAHNFKFIYPLVEAKITKSMVLDFWSKQPFDLALPGEHYGNCVWCWKKSFRKLMTLAVEQPDVFNFPQKMESQYDASHRFYRGNKSVKDIFDMAAKPFNLYKDKLNTDLCSPEWDIDLDMNGACGESCEVGADTVHLEL